MPPVLKLTTMIEGQPVNIDGKLFHISHPDALTLKQALQLEALTPRLGALMQRVKTLTDDEDSELQQALDSLCRLVLDAPEAVHGKLRDVQRLQVAQAFTQLRPTDRRPTGAPPKQTRSTGAASSRGSRGSTGGRSATGSSRSRSAS